MRIRITHYSSFYDPKTRVQFSPVLDRRSGVHVGIAEVTRAVGETYLGRDGFDAVSNEEWLAMTSMPEEPAPAEGPATGDPLADQAARKPDAPADLSQLDYKELVTLAKERGIEHHNVKKADLVAALQAAASAHPSAGAPPPPPPSN